MLSPFTLAAGLSDHTLAVRYALYYDHTHAFGFYCSLFALLAVVSGIAFVAVKYSHSKYAARLRIEDLLAIIGLSAVVGMLILGVASLVDNNDAGDGHAGIYRTELQARHRLPSERSRLSRQRKRFHRRGQPGYRYVLEYRQLRRDRWPVARDRQLVDSFQPGPYHVLHIKFPYPCHNF